MSSHKTLNIGNTGASRNQNIGSGGQTSSRLEGARPITNVESGQATQQTKLKQPSDVKKILPSVVDNVSTVGTHLDTVLSLRAEARNLSDAAEKDSEHYTKRSQIGTTMVTAIDGALAAYDSAIAEMKKISPTVKLAKCNVTGLPDKLNKLSLNLSSVTAGQLLNRLIELRSQTYDNKVSAEAWIDYSEAMLSYFQINKQSDRIDEMKKGQAAEAWLKSREREIAEQIYLKWNQKCQDKYESCLKRLASGSAEMPDEEPANSMFTNAIGNLFPVRKTLADNRECVQFNSAGSDFSSAHTTHDDHLKKGQLATDEDKSKSIQAVLDKADKAVKLGLDAVRYIDNSINFYDDALTKDSCFNDYGKQEMLKEKEELQQGSADFLHNVFTICCAALRLAALHPEARYKTELVESLERLRDTEIELAVLHQACCETMKKHASGATSSDADSQPKLKVPEHLLHPVLKDLAEKYEDLAYQCQYVLERFKKEGEAVETNKTMVRHIQGYADAIAKMRETIDSELGRVDEAGLSQKPKGKSVTEWAAEAQTWGNDTLRKVFPDSYDANVKDDALVEQTGQLSIGDEEIVIEEPEKQAPAPVPAQAKNEPTPAKIDPAKDLQRAVAAAEKSETKSAGELEKLDKDSRKYSGYARTGEQKGYSPCTVEKYMELAATQETRLANKKTQIANKFKNAFEMMSQNDARRAMYGAKVDELTAQAAQHMENGEQLRKEGRSLRINMSKKLPPTHSLFHYLKDQKEISGVALTKQRERFNRVDEKGQVRKDPRTNENIVDYMDEYTITLKGGKKFVAHIHYRSEDANDNDMVACHFKTWEQRKMGALHVMREAAQGREVEIYRAKTNTATLQALKQLSARRG